MGIIAVCAVLLTIALIFGRKTAAKLVIAGLWTLGGILVLLVVGGGLYWAVSSAMHKHKHEALMVLVRQEAQIRAPGRRLMEKWLEQVTQDAQTYNYSKEEIDSRIERDLKADGITPWEKETQQELEKEVRNLPKDQLEVFRKFFQTPEAGQKEVLATIHEHDRALIEEFKREQSLKGLPDSSRN